MILGFLVQRTPYYKAFAPLIDEALKRGHKVFCFHDYSQPKQGKKAYQFPYLTSMPRFKNGLAFGLAYKTEDELVKLVLQNQVQIMVSLNYFLAYQGLKDKLKGVLWAGLQYSLDAIDEAEHLTEPDKYFFHTTIWLDFAQKYVKLQGKQITKQDSFAFAGFSELDQAKLVDREAIRKKWKIPEQKKVILFLPFPFGSSNYWFWPKIIYGGHNFVFQFVCALLSFKPRLIRQVLKRENDKQLCLALRKFCDRNDAFLLVKLRKKDPLKPYLAKLADEVVFDESYYPATIIECLAVADLCVNFASTAVIEAVGMAVPNLCIMPPKNDYRHLQHPLWKLLFEQFSDFMDFQGVSQSVSVRDVFRVFKEKTLNDFALDSQAQKQYVDKYIGISESSKKIADDIETMLQK